MANKKGTALLMVWAEVPDGKEEDFNNWYNKEHMEERLSIPGVLSAARYESTSPGAPKQAVACAVGGHQHTGEQIYLRQNFRELIEGKAVNIVGPDPCDVGGIAELKWIAEYADLHGVLMAPHGTGDGLLGLAALVQVSATLPHNYIGFEYPVGNPPWWYDIVDGLPNPIVKDSFIEVWDRPGMGVELIPEEAKKYLREEDSDFFD